MLCKMYISVAGSEGEKQLGPLALFSFVVQTRVDTSNSKQQTAELKASLRSHLQDGVLLDAKEKSGKIDTNHFLVFECYNDHECDRFAEI